MEKADLCEAVSLNRAVIVMADVNLTTVAL